MSKENLDRYNEMLKARFAAKLAQTTTRSTLTRNNADEFKDYFDEAFNKQSDVIIPYEKFIRYTPNTFMRKVYDARRWLSLNGSDEDRAKYTLLTASTKLKLSPDPDEGLIIQWVGLINRSANTSPELQKVIAEAKEKASNTDWKERVFSFIENPSDNILNLTGLMLGKDDIEFVENICQQNMWEYKVNTTTIRIVK